MSNQYSSNYDLMLFTSHHENKSLRRAACSSSCFFFFPTAGEADTFLAYKSKLDVVIFPSLLSQSKTKEILGPK